MSSCCYSNGSWFPAVMRPENTQTFWLPHPLRAGMTSARAGGHWLDLLSLSSYNHCPCCWLWVLVSAPFTAASRAELLLLSSALPSTRPASPWEWQLLAEGALVRPHGQTSAKQWGRASGRDPGGESSCFRGVTCSWVFTWHCGKVPVFTW